MPAIAAATLPAVSVLSKEESIEEMVRLVVDALVAVSMVVEAYGMESAVVRGALKVMPGDTLPTTVNAEQAMPLEQDAEEVATDCRAPEPEP